jgi:hypothetical protein
MHAGATRLAKSLPRGTAGEIGGNCWVTAGEIVGNGWVTAGEIVGNGWVTAGEIVGNGWITAGNGWITAGEIVGNGWEMASESWVTAETVNEVRGLVAPSRARLWKRGSRASKLRGFPTQKRAGSVRAFPLVTVGRHSVVAGAALTTGPRAGHVTAN